MIEKPVALIGFMGSGKSVVGKLLSNKLNFHFIDLDSHIEKELGKSIARIFSEEGEASFRAHETRALDEVIKASRSVVSCGGGIILSEANTAKLKQNAITVYLKASQRVLHSRLSHSRNRPLLKNGDRMKIISSLLSIRESLYEQTADIVVDISDLKPEEAADVIITGLKNHMSTTAPDDSVSRLR
jgi:shikimate kinase